MERLANAFNPAAAAAVMCRHTISVGWDGTLYDCDFNQMLDLPVESSAPRHIKDFDAARLHHRRIVMANHCYAAPPGPVRRAAAQPPEGRRLRDSVLFAITDRSYPRSSGRFASQVSFLRARGQGQPKASMRTAATAVASWAL